MTDRLAISFWIWGVFDTKSNAYYHDLDSRMVELKERGFNCIRLESGAGLCHDKAGQPRGELVFREVMPGEHMRMFRGFGERFMAGRCDPLKRLIELCTLAKRYEVKVILSSWYYLHTFWFTDEAINAELLELPAEERFMYFARALDYLLNELEQRGLQDTIAFAEIFNEADGLDFVGFYGEKTQPKAELNRWRSWHEDALEFLKVRHPGVRFALDTYTPYINTEHVPRNMQVWNFHSYYLWSVYDVLERAITWGAAAEEPVVGESVRKFLRRDIVPYHIVRSCRGNRPPIMDDWYHRVWLYRNLEPAALPELERMLQDNLVKNIAEFKLKAEEGVAQAVKLRDQHYPGVPLVFGEGASYCADLRLRWEERSDAYWEVVEHAARAYREHGLWGAVARTNSGPEDPAWHEYPERLRRVNEEFLGSRVSSPLASARRRTEESE
jgi:hypothetical protein